MTRLGVNIDHVATVRQARQAPEPDVVAAAVLAELGGAHGITVHLRGDRRHIQDRDVFLLRDTISTRLNIEMAATREMMRIAAEVRPSMVTFVPEREGEVTTEGGLDVVENEKSIRRAIQSLQDTGIEVSLFIDPVAKQIERSAEIGASLIELNTAAYANAVPKGLNPRDRKFQRELDKVAAAARSAVSLGIEVLAGHGLTYRNVRPISDIPEIVELNIGHNIVARAVLVGMQEAVREMIIAMNG